MVPPRKQEQIILLIPLFILTGIYFVRFFAFMTGNTDDPIFNISNELFFLTTIFFVFILVYYFQRYRH